MRASRHNHRPNLSLHADYDYRSTIGEEVPRHCGSGPGCCGSLPAGGVLCAAACGSLDDPMHVTNDGWQIGARDLREAARTFADRVLQVAARDQRAATAHSPSANSSFCPPRRAWQRRSRESRKDRRLHKAADPCAYSRSRLLRLRNPLPSKPWVRRNDLIAGVWDGRSLPRFASFNISPLSATKVPFRWKVSDIMGC